MVITNSLYDIMMNLKSLLIGLLSIIPKLLTCTHRHNIDCDQHKHVFHCRLAAKLLQNFWYLLHMYVTHNISQKYLASDTGYNNYISMKGLRFNLVPCLLLNLIECSHNTYETV